MARLKRGYLKCEETNVVYGAQLGQAVSVSSGKRGMSGGDSRFRPSSRLAVHTAVIYLLAAYEYANRIKLVADISMSRPLITICSLYKFAGVRSVWYINNKTELLNLLLDPLKGYYMDWISIEQLKGVLRK